jgi:hypothetical protein
LSPPGGLGWLSHDDLLREFSESQGAQGNTFGQSS